MAKYRIEGHLIKGKLGRRLDEVRITGLNSMEGVIVYTDKGPFYSELYEIGCNEPIPRNQLNEETQGLLETTIEEYSRFKNKIKIVRELY